MSEEIRYRTNIDLDRVNRRVDGDTELWESIGTVLRGIPSYGDVPCKGQHPIFDMPDTSTEFHGYADSNTRALYRLVRSPGGARAMFRDALELCDTCPLRGLRGRCATDTLGADRRYSGVAGGWVFLEGQPIASSTHIHRGGEPVYQPSDDDNALEAS